MCGLAGVWDPALPEPGALLAAVRGMADALRHRGPDDADAWCDAGAGLALGHRRLSVIDLSPEGRQPMETPDGRFVLAFNGEVYSFPALRADLEGEGVRFRGRSDTEVVLHALARWGVERALSRFVGMFALALWDVRERRLLLARDRLGVKPLYYGWTGAAEGSGALVFGSELRALQAHPGFRAELDRDAAASFLRHAYVPAPHAILRGARKLEPGTLAVVDAPGRVRVVRWWDPAAVARAAQDEPLELTPEEAAEAVEAQVDEAVRDRLVSDVPVGAFLSGGVDSSLVVAAMRRAGADAVRTFTIGFDEDGYDEAAHARAVAAHLGTDHVELRLSAEDALQIVPRLPEVWDEPFADSSQLPTWLVSRLAAAHVTVCLSGDGGDELFGGYARYFRARRTWSRVGALPRPLRRAAAGLVRGVPRGAWEAIGDPLLPETARRLGPANAASLLADVLSAPDEAGFYRHVVSHWKRPAALVRASEEPSVAIAAPGRGRGLAAFTERMMAHDASTYLPDDILVKVDRASMAHGLEARVPLCDHRLFELAWRLPHAVRVGPAPGKRVLRDALARRVPRSLFERPKQGFSVPVAEWLRGPLRAWAEELLDPRRLAEGDLLDPAPVRRAWDEHQAGRSRGYLLWDVLMLQAWRERWRA